MSLASLIARAVKPYGTVYPPRSARDIAAYDQTECEAGYLDCRPNDPAPGENRSPAFRWGWANRCRDRSREDDGFDAMRRAYFNLNLRQS